jgi:alkanesulfonate monooxygenase SsuD/methylene tetrahydromethanopterin reductase-like flavin-dependent oxidoreductase (luciferase family)
VPIWIGALGDRMAAVGGELADGVVLALATEDRIRAIRRIVGPEKTVAAIVFCCLREDRVEARAILRGATTGYLRRPYYRRMLADSGIAIRDSFDDVAIDALTIGGPPGYARERLAAYAEAGADLVLMAPPLRGEPDQAAAYRAIARLTH